MFFVKPVMFSARFVTTDASLVVALLLSLLTASTTVVYGQQTTSAGEPTSANRTEEKRNDYRIGAGDVLLIEVAGEPDLRRKVKVMEQGTIRLPYIDHDIKVSGLTEREMTELLRQEFIVILKEPQVTLYIDEYHARMASIAGAVNQSKQVALTREIRLYDLISMAGGLTDKAGNIVQLIHTRPEDSLDIIDIRELVRRPELNRVIRDGDFVNVPEAGIIYVTGNVNKPGSFPIKDSIKLSQAIAMAGGVAADSRKKEIRLVRASDASQTSATEQIVNLLEIEKDPGKDIILKPYDVVMVPESTRTKQTKTLIQAFAGGLASALGWGILR